MRRLLLTAVLLFSSSTSLFAEPIISVNFIGGRTTATGGGDGSASVTGSAGVVPAINWNNFLPPNGSSGLFDNSGNAAGSITWASPNTYSATAAAPGGGGNADLMSGYLDNFHNSTGIQVSGLGSQYTSAGYDVYVYFNNDGPGTRGYNVTDSLGNTDTGFGRQAGGAGSNYPLIGPDGFIVSEDTINSADTLPSNVVRLTGFFGPQFTLTGVVGGFGDGRPHINGFQIVSNQVVPEPASVAMWSLLGVGLFAVGVFHRRKGKLLSFARVHS